MAVLFRRNFLLSRHQTKGDALVLNKNPKPASITSVSLHEECRSRAANEEARELVCKRACLMAFLVEEMGVQEKSS